MHKTTPPETDPGAAAAGAEPPASLPAGSAPTLPAEPEPAVAMPGSPDPALAATVEPEQPQAAPGAASPPEMTAAACAARLAELFPGLFGTQGPPKPVKLRVHADVQQRAPGQFTRRVLSAFMARHTTTSAYLRALVESPHRYDLDGQAAGDVAEEHRQAAREELARRRALRRGPGGPPRRADAAPPQAATQAGAPDTTPSPQPRPREPRPEGRDRSDRPPRQGRPRTGPPHQAPGDRRPPGPQRPPSAPTPFDPAQRARQQLVRAWESSPLAKANFCALMRVSVAELDAAVEQVQQERRARADAPPTR